MTNTWRSENETKSVSVLVSPRTVGIGEATRSTGKVVVQWSASKNDGSYCGAWKSPAMSKSDAQVFVDAKRASLGTWLAK